MVGSLRHQLGLVFMVALSIDFETSSAVSNGCSDVCEYYEWGKDAKCQGRNLMDVPQECRNAKTLRLQDNQVRLLPQGVFSNFSCLKYLYLERNNMTLQRGAFKGCSMLTQIRLNNNVLPTLTPGIMEGLTNKLQVMFMDNIGMTDISDSALEHLTELQYLSLKNNKLTLPPCNALSENNTLDTLFLTSNRISELPNECFSALRQLKRLYLTNNPLVDPNGLAFSGLVNLKLLDLQYTNLSRVPTGIFPYANSIETLYLSFNNIPFLNNRDFASLSRLRNLYLQHNGLVSIHQQSFEFLSTIEILDLSYNLISSIGVGALSGLDHLNDLRLQHNHLNSTKNISFSDISSDAKLHVARNPLHCDCSIFPFQYWLQTATELTSDTDTPSSYLARCATPQKFNRRLVSDLDTQDICADRPEAKPTSAKMVANNNIDSPTDHDPKMMYEQAFPSYADDTNSEPFSSVKLIAIVAGCIVCFILIVGVFILYCMKRRSDQKRGRNYYYDECYEEAKKPAQLNRVAMNVTMNPLPDLPQLPPRTTLQNSALHAAVGTDDQPGEGTPGYVSKMNPNPTRPKATPQFSFDSATTQDIEEEGDYSTFFVDDNFDQDTSQDEVPPEDFIKQCFQKTPPQTTPATSPEPSPPPISVEAGYVPWHQT